MMNIESNLNRSQRDSQDELLRRLKKVLGQLQEHEADKSDQIEAVKEKIEEIESQEGQESKGKELSRKGNKSESQNYDPDSMSDPEIDQLAGEVLEVTGKLPNTHTNREIFIRLFKTSSDEELSNVRHGIGEKDKFNYQIVGGIADLVKDVKKGEVF